MEKSKEYQFYLSRVTKKGQRALAEFEIYFEEEIKKHGEEHGSQIVQYFIIVSAHPILNLPQKSAIIQIFQHIIYVIQNNQDLKGYVPQLVGCILKFFNDPSDKVRYNAISSIYNVFKFMDEECLVVFTRTFKQLPCIITDTTSEVRQAAAHLNHTMKTLLNNAILDHYHFDYDDFINILTQNFLLPDHLVKQFLIDWINTMAQIRGFESAKYLPLFLKKLFVFLVDQNKNVRIKAQECLKGLIDSFKLSFTCYSKQSITVRFKQQDTQAILILLIKIIEQSLIFQVSSEIDIHVLRWLDNFTGFLIDEIDIIQGKKEQNEKQRENIMPNNELISRQMSRIRQQPQPFLIKIYTLIFKPLFKVLIQVMSIQNKDIRRTATGIHQKLLKAYPALRRESKQIDDAANYLYTSIGYCKSLVKGEIIIKWTALMAEYGNQLIIAQIQKFIIFIVEKMCQSNQKNLSRVFILFRNSVFSSVGRYFEKLIKNLLIQISIKKCQNQTFLLKQIVLLPNPPQNYLILVQQIIHMESIKNTIFKHRICDLLLEFLITSPSLAELREIIRNGKPAKEIVQVQNKQNAIDEICIKYQWETFRQLIEMFSQNKASLLGFCFLIREYTTICQLLEEISLQQNIDSRFMKSLIKVGNLLLTPSMQQLFLDMQGIYDIKNKRLPQKYLSRKAYLSLLMSLPVNKMTRPLKTKIDELEIEESEDSQCSWDDGQNSFYQQFREQTNPNEKMEGMQRKQEDNIWNVYEIYKEIKETDLPSSIY